MDLTKVFDVNLIDLELKAKTKIEAITNLVQLMYANDKIKSKEKFAKMVLKREEIVSTGIGMGIAIPHAKSAMVKKACIAVGRSVEGVEFNSLDQQPAHLIFLIALPESEAEEEDYTILTIISRKLAHMKVRDKLLNITKKDDIIEIFKDLEIDEEE